MSALLSIPLFRSQGLLHRHQSIYCRSLRHPIHVDTPIIHQFLYPSYAKSYFLPCMVTLYSHPPTDLTDLHTVVNPIFEVRRWYYLWFLSDSCLPTQTLLPSPLSVHFSSLAFRAAQSNGRRGGTMLHTLPCVSIHQMMNDIFPRHFLLPVTQSRMFISISYTSTLCYHLRSSPTWILLSCSHLSLKLFLTSW